MIRLPSGREVDSDADCRACGRSECEGCDTTDPVDWREVARSLAGREDATRAAVRELRDDCTAMRLRSVHGREWDILTEVVKRCNAALVE